MDVCWCDELERVAAALPNEEWIRLMRLSQQHSSQCREQPLFLNMSRF